MEIKVNNNEILWSNMGEEVLVEAYGTSGIRIRASYRSCVDRSLNWNLIPVKAGSAKAERTEEQAILENGNIKAVITGNGVIAFYKKQRKKESCILREYWIDEGCGMPSYQQARSYKGGVGNRYHIKTYFYPNEGEHLYGMGQEVTGCFDLKGCTIDLCQKNTKCSIPFYLSTKGYGFLWNNPSTGRAEFAKNRFLWEADVAKQLDYIVIAGDNPGEIMQSYTEMTGRAPEFPEWAYGLWQSKLRYRTQDEVLEIARDYKRRGLPLSVLVIDYFHWPAQGDWRFDERYFKEPEKMVKELEDMGIKPMISVWPTVDPRSENYREMLEKGYLVTCEHGVNVVFMCRGPETYIDLTNPEARHYLWNKIQENYGKHGIRCFWIDESEPEMYPYDYENIHYYQGNGAEVSNIYPYWYAETFAGKAELTLVRCAWIGSQRLGTVMWSGDVPSTFDSFRQQVIAGLHIAVCGIPWWTTDIGGFYGGDAADELFRELMIRWFQFGVFCPVLRMHGYRRPYDEAGSMDDMSGPCNSGAPNELWSFGEEAYEIMKKFLFIREELKPYLKKQMKKASESGIPPMRPLLFDFMEDENTWQIEDEYLFGDLLLVAPVMEYKARKRRVYLPRNTVWKNVWTGECSQGGTHIIAEAPLEQIPLFIKTL